MPRESFDNSVLSDDDYDVISEPSESSVAELGPGLSLLEPQPLSVALNLFNTASLTSEEIQEFIQNAVPSSVSLRSRTVKVYVDGFWDAFNVSHAHQLRQAKLSFPRTSLLVGVFCDSDCQFSNLPTTVPFVERAELVRHCRWVDNVLEEAPFRLSLDFCKQQRIDFVAVLEGSSVDPSVDKERVKGYDELRAHGKVIPIRRTTGVVSANQRSAAPTPAAVPPPPLPQAPQPLPVEDEDDSPFRHDVYGIGI